MTLPDLLAQRVQTWWSGRVMAMRRDKRRTALTGAAYLLGIAFLDYATGYEINISVLYLTPLIMFTVAGGVRAGLAATAACAASVVLTDLLAGKQYDHAAYHLCSFLSHGLSYLSFMLLFSQLLHLYDQEREAAGRDALTGLRNRRGFLDQGLDLLQAGARRREPCCLAVFDLRDFKEFNASHGYDQGDRLLTTAAEALRRALPEGALLSRTGADRFAALLPASAPARDGFAAARQAADRAVADLGATGGFRLAVRDLPPVKPTPDELAHALDALVDATRAAPGP